MVGLYRRYPDIEPADNNKIYVDRDASACVVLAVIWRGFLVRRELPLKWLYAIDLFYATGTGTIFARQRISRRTCDRQR